MFKFARIFIVLFGLTILGGLSSIEKTLSNAEGENKILPGLHKIPNPAAYYCNSLGYRYETKEDKNGQIGVCNFPDDKSCDAWSFFQGECGQDKNHCAKIGKKTKVVDDGKNPYSKKYAVCVDPDGNESGSVTDLMDFEHNLVKSTCGESSEQPTPEENSSLETYSSPDPSVATELVKQTAVPAENRLVPAGSLPASFDWHNYLGEDWMTPIKDQGYCGSCWAFGAVGAAEAAHNIANGNPNLDLNLAEEYLVSDCSSAGTCCGGWHYLALDYIRDYGIPDEECMPYVDGADCSCSRSGYCYGCNYSSGGSCSERTCSDRCSDYSNRLVNIDAVLPLPNDINVIKQALVDNGPIAVAISLNGTWDSNDVYSCPAGGNTDHVVVITGYNDGGGYWIVKNSWGGTYDSGGYFKVGYNQCLIQDYAYQAIENPPVTPPDLVVESISYTPSEPVPGQPIDFTIRVKNQGGAPTGNFRLDFYIDHQPTRCGDQNSAVYWRFNSLAAGEIQEATYTYAGFSAPGTYKVNAFADSACEASESAENNNMLGPQTVIVKGQGIRHEETATGGSVSLNSVTTSGSVTGANGNLYLAAISSRNRVVVSGVSGLGLSWSKVRSQCSARTANGIEVWKAIGSPTGNGTVTATFASTPSYAVIAVSRYSGVDAANPIGNPVSANTMGVSGACSGGVDTLTYSLNLPTSVNGAVAYGAVAMRARSHMPGSGYTERGEIIQSTAVSVAVEDKAIASPSTVAVNGSFSGTADWAAVALEIKPAGSPPTQYSLSVNSIGSGSVTLSPPGGLYNPGTSVQMTAVPASGWSFSGWSGDLNGSANPVTITMNGNKSVTATFTQVPPSQYTLSIITVGQGSVTLNPEGGVYAAGTSVQLTAVPASGWSFGSWSGDLSGNLNPATITMTGNKNVTATFSQAPIGQVIHEETKTGGSTGSSSVTTSASLTGVSGNLYLAAIASRSPVAVSSVSGLGLSWTRVKAQCAGRNQTGMEVWMAHGYPNENGAVTATFAAAPGYAAIAVSRYSGVSLTNPIGNVVSGNTNGANGACSGGVDSAAYLFNLPVTTNGAAVYGAATMRAKNHNPGVGYIERAEYIQAASASVAIEDKTGLTPLTVVVDGTFSGAVDWSVIIIEIKP